MGLNVNNPDIAGNMFDRYEQGQRIAANQAVNKQNSANARSVEDMRNAQMLIRAMQLGVRSPEDWDNAMQSATRAGSPDAAGFVGKWSPVRSRQLLQSYQDAYGFGPQAGASQRGIGTAAPTGPAPAASAEQPFNEGVMQAISRMNPDERRAKVSNYDHIVNEMAHVTNEADLQALTEDLKGRGILDAQAAAHYDQLFSDPVNKWENFYSTYQNVTNLRDHLRQYTDPQELGVNPIGPEPTYKTEWDAKNGIGVTTTMAPGQAPTFTTTQPRGGPGAIGLPDGLKDRFEMESQTRQRWSLDAQPLLVQKQAIDNILSLAPGKTTGVDELAAIYNMVKILDPTSVVREGEIELLQQAQSIVGRMKTLAGQAQSGHLMTPEILTQMQGAASKLKTIAKKTYDWRRQQMMNSVGDYQPYVDPNRAVPNFWQPEAALPPPPGDGIGSNGKSTTGNQIIPAPGVH